MLMKRKEFVHKTGAAALLMSMGAFLGSCSDDSDDMLPDDDMDDDDDTKITFDLNDNTYSGLKNEDSWMLHPQENVLIVNVDGNIRAFTSVCTHSGCVDDWAYAGSMFICNCHGSRFDNAGKVTNGPATRDLEEFSVSTNNDIVEITI